MLLAKHVQEKAFPDEGKIAAKVQEIMKCKKQVFKSQVQHSTFSTQDKISIIFAELYKAREMLPKTITLLLKAEFVSIQKKE